MFEGQILAFQEAGERLDPEKALSFLAAGRFERLASAAPDFGFTPEGIWLYFELFNPTEEESWRLRLRENFFQGFEVWFVRGSEVLELLEAQDETTPFSTRRVSWAELVAAFELPQGEEGAILIRYRSGGSTEVTFNIFDAPRFGEWSSLMTARNFTYYGMLAFLILASSATWAATRQGIFIAYSAYALSALLFIMHADGNTFRYLWPNAPAFNAFASVPLGVAIICFGANFARQFLQTTIYHPVFDKVLVATITIALALGVSSLVVDTQLVKKLLVLAAFGSVLVFTASGINAARTRFREVRFYLIAWSGAVISSAIMTSRHWLGFEISEDVQFNSMRIVFVLDAALMGLAILDRFNALRRSQSDALMHSLAQAERNLDLSRRLQALEKSYRLATDLNRNREQKVADAIHDLRQPLHALRLRVQDAIARDSDVKAQARDASAEIEETFGFLERLVDEELEDHASGRNDRTPSEEDETVSLQEIFDAVSHMFGKEAREKGLALTMGRTDARLRLPAMAAMRILSNLTANAVRYSDEGAVELAAKAKPDGTLSIEVCDTGSGMTATEFEAALPRAARLKNSEGTPGSGLGLAIVAETCARHGLSFKWIEKEGPGTRLGVMVPARLIS
ncbi:MAG: sensor histidine kinase [Pseudomonadota bacterium]